MRIFRTFFWAILILFSLNLNAGTLGYLAYHPEDKELQNDLYNFGNTAFAVDYFSKPQLNLAPGFEFFKGYQKSQPDFYLKQYTYSISDLENPYLGFFYPLSLGNSPFLLGINFNLKYMVKENGGDEKTNTSFYKETKLIFSGKKSALYYGGYFFFQHFSHNDTMHDYRVYDINNMSAEYDNFSQTNIYYQLSAGYQPSKESKLGLTLDNKYKSNQESIPEIISYSEIMGDLFVPYMSMSFFQSNIYRFNYSHNNEYVYANPPHNSSLPTNLLLEKLKDINIYHANFQYEYHLSWLDFFLLSQYHYVKYESKMDTTDFSYWNQYVKKGTFHNLDYTLILTPKLSKEYLPNKWHLNLKMVSLLYSKLSEEITHISENGVIPTINRTTSFKTYFSRTKVELTGGYTTPSYELWLGFTTLSGEVYINEFVGPLTWGNEIYSGIYPSFSQYISEYQNKDFKWSATQLVFANRFKLNKIFFDAALSFMETNNDSDNGVEAKLLSPSFSISYLPISSWQFKIQYRHDIYLSYKDYSEAKAYASSLSFNLNYNF